jgi:hypothetical protein
MTKNKENFVRADRALTDGEIELAVERLSPNWTRAGPRPRTGGTSYILQSLAHAARTRRSWRSNVRPVRLGDSP